MHLSAQGDFQADAQLIPPSLSLMMNTTGTITVGVTSLFSQTRNIYMALVTLTLVSVMPEVMALW